MDMTWAFRNCEIGYDGTRFEVVCYSGPDRERLEPGLSDDQADARAKQIARDLHYWTEECAPPVGAADLTP